METRRLIEATCPECRGPLTEIQDGELVVYECLVGHRYSPEALLRTHYEAEERALWAAVVGLEEAEKLVEAVTPHLSPETGKDLPRDGKEKRQQAQLVRQVLDQLKAYRLGDGTDKAR
jgi:two-component system chemotaxis response regulator CheB